MMIENPTEWSRYCFILGNESICAHDAFELVDEVE